MKTERFDEFTLRVDLLQKAVKQLKNSYAATIGVKGVHTFWIYQLYAHPEGLTAAELATKSRINRSLVSREIDELERASLVETDGDGTRRYNSRIRLTDRGLETARKISERALQIQSLADKGISKEEFDSFYATLDKLCNNFTAIIAALPRSDKQ